MYTINLSTFSLVGRNITRNLTKIGYTDVNNSIVIIYFDFKEPERAKRFYVVFIENIKKVV